MCHIRLNCYYFVILFDKTYKCMLQRIVMTFETMMDPQFLRSKHAFCVTKQRSSWKHSIRQKEMIIVGKNKGCGCQNYFLTFKIGSLCLTKWDLNIYFVRQRDHFTRQKEKIMSAKTRFCIYKLLFHWYAFLNWTIFCVLQKKNYIVHYAIQNINGIIFWKY